MAKKKRKPDKHKRKNPPIPDRRAMEGVMQEFVAGLQGHVQQDSPLGKAQALMYRAFDEPDLHKRIQLALDALDISPDCADAFNLLAEHASSRKETRRLYELGVAAGERALGPEAFQRDVGHFWGILETRPYMRARIGLAHGLWSAGRREEAVQHLQDMLRLNPNDNQGVRYTLAGFLLFLDRDDDLARLLDQYDESMATWAYTKALLAFRKHGDTPETRHLLSAAKKANKHVPLYLLGEKQGPPFQPDYYSPGDENEAVNYIGGFLAAWKFTPGALAWLRANIVTKRRKEAEPKPRGPLDFIKKWLNNNLSQKLDVWQAAFHRMPNWIRIGAEMRRPWTVLVTSRTNDLIMSHLTVEQAPTAAHLWDTLVQAMQSPAAGRPHRPTELQIRGDQLWDDLKPHLEEIGVGLVVTDDLGDIDAVFQDMTEHICGKPRPGLLDMPGVTPESVGSYFDAAAFFFEKAPWKKLGDEAAIMVECDKFQSGPWYAVVMGQSGMTTGVALYEDLKALRRIWNSQGDDSNLEYVATPVTYGEEWTIPVADLEAAQKHDWKVAREDAYPEVFHKDRGLSLRPPLAWQLELVEGCLRAIPEFVNRHTQDEEVKDEITVLVASGELKMALSWVGEEDRN